jgi:hypothetical protein
MKAISPLVPYNQHSSQFNIQIFKIFVFCQDLPGAWNKKLNSFQKLLVLRVLREEKLVYGTRKFVRLELGEAFSESPPFNLESAYLDSSNITPLIFVLSPGADINDYLLELAKNKGKLGGGLKIISLGQGQGPIAERCVPWKNDILLFCMFFILFSVLGAYCRVRAPSGEQHPFL